MTTTDSPIPKRVFSLPLNCLFTLMQKKEWKGKHRFYTWLSEKAAHKLIQHQFGEIPFVVPVDEWCFWLEYGPQNYYLDEFVPFFKAINTIQKPFSFFDLGADIGTVSALVNQYCPDLAEIIAFEPNSSSFDLLAHNVNNIPIKSHCINAAISNFDGKVAFKASSQTTIDHEGSIDVNSNGNTQVYSLDSWCSKYAKNLTLSSHIVLKIDVEGQELALIQGARLLIETAQILTIMLELHPDVLEQTNTSVERLFEELESIRTFNWYLPKNNNQKINREIPFFNQFEKKQYDVIATSYTLSGA